MNIKKLILFLLLVPQYVFGAVDYDRNLYLKRWLDADRDCQNTRQEVLIAESIVPVTFDEKGCKVIAGRWYDPYTGNVYTDPRILDVDHFVPLKEAHVSGGDQWSEAKRQAYANDITNPYVLIAVYRGANRSKGARGPAYWMPRNKAYHCDYIKTWINVKESWDLSTDEVEEKAINRILLGCG